MPKAQLRTPEMLALAVKLYGELGSGNAVAKRLQVSPPTAYRLLRDAGVHVPGWEDPKPKRRAFDSQTEAAVVDDYLAGMPLADLSAKYKSGQYAIRSAVKRAGHKLRDHGAQRRRVSKDEEKEILRLYEAGLSQTQVGLRVGAHQTVVSAILRRNDIATRGRQAQRSNNWRGGLCRTGSGYILELVPPGNPLSSMRTRAGYVMQHRLVMARHLGRALAENETVHHVNGDKTDNRIENLQLRRGKHGKGAALVCACCGSNNIVEKEL